jgi:hypothetical protein
VAVLADVPDADVITPDHQDVGFVLRINKLAQWASYQQQDQGTNQGVHVLLLLCELRLETVAQLHFIFF